MREAVAVFPFLSDSTVAEEKPKEQGRGIHLVRRSDLRIRNLRLSFDQTSGKLVESSMITELRTDIFEHWLKIAGQATRESEEARRDALKADTDEPGALGGAIQREFEASMVAVVASAFAIDAFFASVVEHAPATRTATEARHSTILETFKRAFSLRHAGVQALREPLRVTFVMRREAAHPPATWVEPVLHPIFKFGMDPRFVRFRAENAINAQFLAQHLIARCVRKPKARYANLVSWCEPLVELVPEPPPRPEWASGDETVIV